MKIKFNKLRKYETYKIFIKRFYKLNNKPVLILNLYIFILKLY